MATVKKLAASPMEIADLVGYASKLVNEIAGIQLGERQKGMVENRLKKRMLDLKMDEEAYLEHLQSHTVEEAQSLVSLLTTHHTYFFREYSHFEYLETTGLTALVKSAKAAGRNTLRVWSAASSTGQEAYSLAMFLTVHLRKIDPSFKFEILGTDVDPQSVETAKNGVYHRKEIKDAPLAYLADHWARGTGEIADFVKVKKSLKGFCHFEPANLLNLTNFRKGELFDIIFCRNVFIYFNQQQIQSITGALTERLHADGLLFLGISESLHGLALPVKTLGPSIYARQGSKPANAMPVPGGAPSPVPLALAPKASVSAHTPAGAITPAKPLRLLCVDDSPSVIALLKQIFKTDTQFTIVATAANGIEAAARMKEHAIDVMTLDIHMPEQDGIEYLKKNFGPNHPPVVMVSSVSRDDADLAMQALRSGASDYVEKPALSEMAMRGEEIKMKLLCAYRNGKNSIDTTLDQSFAAKQEMKTPENKRRVVVMSMGDRKKVFRFLQEINKQKQPATVILVEGSANALPAFAKECEKAVGKEVKYIDGPEAIQPGKIYIGDFQKLSGWAVKDSMGKKSAVTVYGNATKKLLDWLQTWSGAKILLDDLGQGAKPAAGRNVDVMAATSFAYVTAEYFSQES